MALAEVLALRTFAETPGWLGLWKSGRLRAAANCWNGVDVIHNRALFVGAGLISAVALALVVAACARAVPETATPLSALWSRSIVGEMYPVVIDRGAVVFGRTIAFGESDRMSAMAFDVSTGKLLWERNGEMPLSGTPLFLAAGKAVDRVNARTGQTIWRSRPLCGKTATIPENTEFQPPAVAAPTYAAVVETTLYVGCNGGKIFALHLSSGRVFASAYPVYLDDYDRIVPLGNGRLAVGGKASGAFMYRQSAIIRSDTLASVVVFGPAHRILGARDGDVLVDDTCCQGSHSDSWPGTIERVSLASGKTVSTVSLHPYPYALPLDKDLPGPGMVLAVGNDLYIGTHSALFVYKLPILYARPRMLYSNLRDLPVVVDNRYLLLDLRAKDMGRSVLLDAAAKARVIWSGAGRWGLEGQRGDVLQLVNYTTGSSALLLLNVTPRLFSVDSTCRISAFNGPYAFMGCGNLSIASRERLGGVSSCITVGQSSICPWAIAAYAL